MNASDGWDEDSVNLGIVTKPSSDSSGPYSVSLIIKDAFTNTSLKTDSFDWTSTPGSMTLYIPDVLSLKNFFVSLIYKNN